MGLSPDRRGRHGEEEKMLKANQKVKCAWCNATSRTDASATLKDGFRLYPVDGEQRVLCPQHGKERMKQIEEESLGNA